jgi:uncharacterized protein
VQRDVDRIEEFYEAWRKRDLKTMALLLTEDVEVVHSAELPWGGRHVGREGMQQFLQSWLEHLEARLVLERLVDAGEQVVAVGHVTGKARHTQLEFEVPLVHVWTVRHGQIVRLESYLDNATLLAALGA